MPYQYRELIDYDYLDSIERYQQQQLSKHDGKSITLIKWFLQSDILRMRDALVGTSSEQHAYTMMMLNPGAELEFKFQHQNRCIETSRIKLERSTNIVDISQQDMEGVLFFDKRSTPYVYIDVNTFACRTLYEPGSLAISVVKTIKHGCYGDEDALVPALVIDRPRCNPFILCYLQFSVPEPPPRPKQFEEDPKYIYVG